MTIRRILIWPDDRLRDVADPVTKWDNELEVFVQDLFDTMYDDEGIGLAAIQVGVRKRVIVLDCGLESPTPIAMVNPVIEQTKGETTFAEGCLSIPGIRAEVDRHEEVTVRYQDVRGASHVLTAAGLLSICIQHEIDHLNGKLYFDHLPEFERKAFLQAYAAIDQESRS